MQAKILKEKAEHADIAVMATNAAYLAMTSQGNPPFAALPNVRRGLLAVLMAVPVASLLGWTFDVAYLKSVVPGLTPMNPVVAVSLLLLSWALVLAWRDSKAARIQMTAIGLLAALAASARIVATYLHQDKTIDTLLFSAKLDAELRPNRMAITTAWCLLAAAVAVLSLVSRSKHREMLAQAFSLIAACTGLVVVNCYAAEVLAGQTPGTSVPMALNVATMFVLFSFATILTTPNNGPTAILLSRSHSAIFSRRLLTTLLIGPPLLGWLTHYGQVHGLYSADYKHALLISIITAGFALTVWAGTRSSSKAEARIRVAEQELRASKDDLEERIAARTSELTTANQALILEIEERKALQEQLLQSQKMESLGSLAGGVAHDFNNVLTGILGYAQLALLKLPEDSNVKLDLEEVVKSAERAAALTKQLLTFARKEIVEPRIVDLNALTSELDGLLKRLIGVDIELVTLSVGDLGSVKVDPAQFEQVLVNLVVNARDAMPSGGKLIIQTENVVVEAPQETHRGKLDAGEYVVLSITDNGSGIDKELQKRIFDPFFTTKEKGRGTGLGLSTCYGIVKNSGGHIAVYSELGCGTTFRIYLPRVDERPDTVPLIEAADIRGGRETLLLVEDELAVRSVAVTVLRESGYHVLEAQDGQNALKVAAAFDGQIDLVVTDVIMPGMGGRELSEVLNLVRPGVPVLFTSGYTDDAMVLQGILNQGMPFLQKPFAPNRLLIKVREVLDKRIAC